MRVFREIFVCQLLFRKRALLTCYTANARKMEDIMFVYSVRASKIKFAGFLALFVLAVAALLSFIPQRGLTANALETVAVQGRDIKFDGIKTEEDLLSFISSLGIQVKTPAFNTAQVDLPRVFDAVYSKYNDIQHQQGFDLSKYRGKTLDRYTFEITNYPVADKSQSGKVYLTLFVYKNKVVGGDISSRDFGGFVRTFVDFGYTDLSES